MLKYALPLTALIASPALAQAAAPGAHIAGGWSPVAAPAKDADVRAAAATMVAQIPGRHHRLARIESAEAQVVAGFNYRITLRLTNHSRWGATVWHKLDRSYQVSDLHRVK